MISQVIYCVFHLTEVHIVPYNSGKDEYHSRKRTSKFNHIEESKIVAIKIFLKLASQIGQLILGKMVNIIQMTQRKLYFERK